MLYLLQVQRYCEELWLQLWASWLLPPGRLTQGVPMYQELAELVLKHAPLLPILLSGVVLVMVLLVFPWFVVMALLVAK